MGEEEIERWEKEDHETEGAPFRKQNVRFVWKAPYFFSYIPINIARCLYALHGPKQYQQTTFSGEQEPYRVASNVRKPTCLKQHARRSKGEGTQFDQWLGQLPPDPASEVGLV
ncbi:hypothetical protein N9L68_03260 [bacterium]|nr:hypothetical protein [bacterium]